MEECEKDMEEERRGRENAAGLAMRPGSVSVNLT